MRNSFFGLVGITCALSCSAGANEPSGGLGTGGAPPFGTGGAGAPVGQGGTPPIGGSSSGGVPTFDETPKTDPGSGPEGSCRAVVQQAEKQEGGIADIIFIVDNSLSMVEEAAAVQKNLNSFSQSVTQKGVDVHVTLVSSPPAGAMGTTCVDPTGIACIFVPGLQVGETGICMDPPLGAAGKCPTQDETNPATGFLHLRENVQSNDALQILQRLYPSYSKNLRPGSAKTFVVVTDDDARGEPNGAAFQSWFQGQPAFQGSVTRFSGLYCITKEANCFNAGTVYQDLVQRTGGITGDMAKFGSGDIDGQFKTVFDSLASAVVKDAVPVACEWNIPAPPDGEELDPNKVNVQYTNGTGAVEKFYDVGDASKCTDQFGGWYYNDKAAPSRVVACPQACGKIQADLSAQIQVLFGCAKDDPPIK